MSAKKTNSAKSSKTEILPAYTIQNRLRSQFNTAYNGFQISQDRFSDEDHTQPDDDIGLMQLLLNHTRGIEIQQPIKGVYTGNVIAPVYYDLTDMENHRRQLLEKADYLDEKIDEELKKQEDANGQKDTKVQKPVAQSKPSTKEESS